MPSAINSNSNGASGSGSGKADYEETPVPFPDDEKDVSIEVSDGVKNVQLAGRNLVKEHIFSGWGNIWKGPNSSLYAKDARKQIKKLDVKELLESVGDKYTWDSSRYLLVQKDTKEPTFTIAELAKYTLSVDRPMSVHILEKRCVTMTDSGYLLTKFIVADPTGCCCLVIFGDSSIYPAVNVGDILVLNSFKVQRPKYDPHPNEATTIRSEKLFQIEFKLLAFDFKREFLFKGINTARWFRDFYAEEGIKVAHQLWSSDSQQFEFPLTHPAKAGIDIGGIVVYVSALMRTKYGPKGNKLYCFRWLQLVSSTKQEKPLTVKLLCNNQNWDRQADIVPGTALVLTNVTLADPDKNCYENYFETASYTRVLLNDDIRDAYLAFRPQSYRNTLRYVAAVKACKQILANENIQWAAGGFPTLNINSDKSLAVKYATEHYRPYYSGLKRRETTPLFVLGYVHAVMTVSVADNNDVQIDHFWRSSKPPNFDWYEETLTSTTSSGNGEDEANGYNTCRSGQTVHTFFPDLSKYAFAYTRNVGPPVQVLNLDQKVFVANNANLDHYKGICKQLLMPSVPEINKSLTDYPLLRPDYFLLEIADPHRKQLVKAMYASAPFDAMENNLLSLIGAMEPYANGVGKRNDAQSEAEEVAMDVDSEVHTSGEQQNSELTVEDQEKQRADTVFALDVLQLESLGDHPVKNLMVNLADFTRFLDDVTPGESASQQTSQQTLVPDNSQGNGPSESQQLALSQVQDEIFSTQSSLMQQE